jgi:hypothetical protein
MPPNANESRPRPNHTGGGVGIPSLRPNWRFAAGEPAAPRPLGRLAGRGSISVRGAGSGQLRTAEKVAEWRTRPPYATQALGGHGVAAAQRVRHPARWVANSPRTIRPLAPPAPPAEMVPDAGWRRRALEPVSATFTARGEACQAPPLFGTLAGRPRRGSDVTPCRGGSATV